MVKVEATNKVNQPRESTDSRDSKRVLITGGTGLLGLHLIKTALPDYEIVASYYKNFPEEKLPSMPNCRFVFLDIRNKRKVFDLFQKNRPDVLIHTASLSNVDYCEKNRREAWDINVVGSLHLIKATQRYGSKMIFISTNAVFDGKCAPYSEDDPLNPLNFYGKTKAETEKNIQESNIDYCIARLMTMYGWNHPYERANPVTWLLERLMKKEKVKIVDDVYNNHLYADSAARALWMIVKLDKHGIYHIAGRDCISRYQHAIEVANVFELNESLITPVRSGFFPNIAPRPLNTCYKTTKMEKELNIEPISLKEGLASMKSQPPDYWYYDWMG